MLVPQWFSQPKLSFNIPVLYYADSIYLIKNTNNILLTKTTAAQNEVALSYLTVRGLYILAVVFVGLLNKNVGQSVWVARTRTLSELQNWRFARYIC